MACNRHAAERALAEYVNMRLARSRQVVEADEARCPALERQRCKDAGLMSMMVTVTT